MRTTIYINLELLDRLDRASALLNISKNDIIGLLISRLTKDNNFDARPFETVSYQTSVKGMTWKIKHVEFEPVFYEKAQDLRRNFKFSVSWFIAYGICEYLDDIVEGILNPKSKAKDNYDRDYTYKAKKFGKIRIFIAIWNIPRLKHLKKLFS
jgi:hypothetical protein